MWKWDSIGASGDSGIDKEDLYQGVSYHIISIRMGMNKEKDIDPEMEIRAFIMDNIDKITNQECKYTLLCAVRELDRSRLTKSSFLRSIGFDY